MPIKTYAEQLEEVQAAITAIMTSGQEYRIGDRWYRRADLEWLQKREEYLMDRYQATNKTGGGIRYAVPTYD